MTHHARKNAYLPSGLCHVQQHGIAYLHCASTSPSISSSTSCMARRASGGGAPLPSALTRSTSMYSDMYCFLNWARRTASERLEMVLEQAAEVRGGGKQ